uniref:Glycosyltransferase family 92 protein n=1 Tax=Culicoides sonorensis TaxID=179676 RepID=A0A336KNC0_CULSO
MTINARGFFDIDQQMICNTALFLIITVIVCVLILTCIDQQKQIANIQTNPIIIVTDNTINDQKEAPLVSDQLYDIATNLVSNFPYKEYEQFSSKSQPTCAPFPDIYDLNYHNTYWQRFVPKSDVTFDIFGAYFDDRPKVGKAVIRFLTVSNVVNPKYKIYCQMWFENEVETVISEVTSYNLIWNQFYIRISDGTHVGHVITCPVPENMNKVPLAVSLVTDPCEKATNSFKVQNNRPENGIKKDFAVCVKGLDFLFDDLSISLVQFMEANFMFGVDKVITYNFGVHPNITKVLNYYMKQSTLELHPISLPANYPNEQFLRHMFLKNRHLLKILQELIPYNDCFYKNMHLYKYILLLDIDEVFVPTQGTNYKEMLSHINGNFSSLYAVNKIFVQNTDDVKFYAGIPNYMEMMQIVTVATNYEKPYIKNVKSFFNTEDLLSLNNHMPYECIGKCVKKELIDKIGQLHHYRKKCSYENRFNCNESKYSVRENKLFWRFKDEFISRTSKVLKELKLVQ